ncbi:uncharacterized protein SAPINGB_P005671 [Magnusiomyces paraingens]|uniref:Protein CASP n=1 Tax=Magnusiomyces paraingens TaxID=2606893 RepID=A0A5E8C0J7_9ASCO|nr:uncharacterized protein SAPINGB_P005671 [Saprochaete ingens]VVT57389.1 unnamed protein product [Saprochaete ingens]
MESHMSEDNKESPPAIQGTQETSLQSSASATEESIVENINLSIPDDKKVNPHTTPFEFALSTWSKIALSQLQRKLDDEGVEILQLQKNSIITRKELALRTKTFRKLSDEVKLTEIKSLLKLYQAEIDNLTQRSKFAESSFMNLYKLIAEAPDPVPLLEASVDSVLAASDVVKLSDENSMLVEKLNKCADYEQIKTKLKDLEVKSVELLNTKVLAKESELKAIFDEKERHWKERENDLQIQVQEAREQIKELRSNTEVLQARLSAKSQGHLADSITDKNTSKSTGRIAELELVASDLERANKRVLETEKRNVELRSELETVRSGTQNVEKIRELESHISDLERSNSILAAQLDTSRKSIAQSKSSFQKKIDSLSRDIEKELSENNLLKQKIDSMQDYESIKRELEILKSMEFDEESDDFKKKEIIHSFKDATDKFKDDEDYEFAENIEGSEHAKNSQSLERMMHTRNKKLVNEITQMRVLKISLENEVSQLQTRLTGCLKENSHLKQLSIKLEEDLAQTNDTFSKYGSTSGPAMSVVSGWGRSVIGNNSTSIKRSGRLSPTVSIVGGYEPNEMAMQSPPSPDYSILPIITQQRDRFRARNSELEEDLKKCWATISQLKKELDSVKRDNVELYEKARYASSYKRSTGNNSSKTKWTRAEESYRDMYEEGISPFQQFKGRESERALSKMGPAERALYSLTRTILVNRTSRNLFAGYCVALHLMVMSILMYGLTWHGNEFIPANNPVIDDSSTL